jgi:hypothetical protein
LYTRAVVELAGKQYTSPFGSNVPPVYALPPGNEAVVDVAVSVTGSKM